MLIRDQQHSYSITWISEQIHILHVGLGDISEKIPFEFYVDVAEYNGTISRAMPAYIENSELLRIVCRQRNV